MTPSVSFGPIGLSCERHYAMRKLRWVFDDFEANDAIGASDPARAGARPSSR
jgi:hypothetical protein